MEQPVIKPQKHVFVCVNQREQGSCCMNVGGMERFRELKQFVLEKGLATKVFVTKTGCLGYCNDKGANIVIHPDNAWFIHTTEKEMDKVKAAILKDL